MKKVINEIKTLLTNNCTDFLIIIGTVIIASLLVNPGEYLVDDEWAFVKSVWHLFDDGKLKILGWNPMSLIFHTTFGTFFSYIFGFSFITLKISTIFLGTIGLLTFNLFLKELEIGKNLRIVAILLLLFNPIYFFLIFTFMTDVPFLTWTILSVYFYYKGEKYNKISYLFLGSLFCSFSLLVRQPGILFAVAAGIYYLVNFKNKDKSLKKIIAVSLFPLISFSLFEYWYLFIHGPTLLYSSQMDGILNRIKNPYEMIISIKNRLPDMLIYFGLFTIPLSIPCIVSLRSKKIRSIKHKTIFILLSGFLTVRVFIKYFKDSKLMPYFLNKISKYGIMEPNEVVLGDRTAFFTDTFWIPITVLSLISIIFILYFIISKISKESIPFKKTISSSNVLIYIILLIQVLYLFLFADRYFYDRHLLPLVPLIIVTLLITINDLKVQKIMSVVFIIPFILFSLVTTWEFNNFNKTIWQAGNHLLKKKIPVMYIDGGYAWDGWNMYEYSYKYKINNTRPKEPWWKLTIAPSIKSNYIISLSKTLKNKNFSYINEGYEVIDKFQYLSVMEKTPFVYILKKK